jgi:hypothetical protein
VNVLPLPVPIWISERGLFLASDRSRFSIALFCTDHSFEESSAGRAFSLPRTWASRLTSRSSSSGRWKVKTSRLRASGSSRFVNCVTVPVLSYANGRGLL